MLSLTVLRLEMKIQIVLNNNNNNTNNGNDSSNNTASDPDANRILTAAIENLKNNRLSELQLQNQNGTNNQESYRANVSGSTGVATELGQRYDQTNQ